MAAFAIAIFAGIVAGNAAGLVLLRALMAMILCYPVGFIVGMICERVVATHKPHDVDLNEGDAESTRADGVTSRSSKEEVTTV